MSSHTISAHRPSSITRGFTLVELKKQGQSGQDPAPQDAEAAKE